MNVLSATELYTLKWLRTSLVVQWLTALPLQGAKFWSLILPTKSIQLCPTLCDSMACRLLGSYVHRTLQAIKLERVSMPFSRGSSQSMGRTHISYISCIGRWGFFFFFFFFTASTTWIPGWKVWNAARCNNNKKRIQRPILSLYVFYHIKKTMNYWYVLQHGWALKTC